MKSLELTSNTATKVQGVFTEICGCYDADSLGSSSVGALTLRLCAFDAPFTSHKMPELVVATGNGCLICRVRVLIAG